MHRTMGVLTVLAMVVATASVAFAVLPPGGTFLDDDCCQHEGYIEALYAAGLINGCSIDPPLYCPLDSVTRAELAVLLLRATDRYDESIPYQGLYADVPESAWFAPAVEQATRLGLMSGFEEGMFKPFDPVARFQVAVHMVLALDGVHPSGAAGLFGDVPQGVWYAPHVERMQALGITNGCSADPLLFCPTDQVTRAEMATFLGRALGLDPITPPPRPSTTTTEPVTTSTGGTTTTTMPVTTTTCPPEVPI